MVSEYLNEYMPTRRLPTGEWVGVRRMLYTVGLFVGLDEVGYRTRFCYPDLLSARSALEEWDGTGDPPGPWIKEKGQVERSNPRLEEGVK